MSQQDEGKKKARAIKDLTVPASKSRNLKGGNEDGGYFGGRGSVGPGIFKKKK